MFGHISFPQLALVAERGWAGLGCDLEFGIEWQVPAVPTEYWAI